MNAYEESQFRSNVNKALQQVKSILDTTRHPRCIDTANNNDGKNDNHTYQDKYLMAESLTAASCVAWKTCLQHGWGMEPEQFTTVWQWVHNNAKTVTLRFQATDACALLQERIVEIEDPTATTTKSHTSTSNSGSTSSTPTSSWMGGAGMTTNSSTTTTTKVARKVKQAHWKVDVKYKISVFAGTDTEHALPLVGRESSTMIVTTSGSASGSGTSNKHGDSSSPMTPPIPSHTLHPAIDLDLTWWLKQFHQEQQNDETTTTTTTTTCAFGIDRSTAKTPRRNNQVEQALQFHEACTHWLTHVETFFTKHVEQVILGQDAPHKALSSSSSDIMPAGTVCKLQNITKQPAFNGKQVIVKEYVASQERYRVEPLHATDGLPVSLLVKAKDLAVDTTSASSTAASAGANAGSVKNLTPAIFIPVQPFVEQQEEQDGKDAMTTILLVRDMDALLAEHAKQLDQVLQTHSKIYPPRHVPKLLTILEATIVITCRHLKELNQHYARAVNYLETLLHKQVTQAIGRTVTPADFTAFMRLHGRRLFSNAYAPRPFCHAIRRGPGHAPDGMISIESSNSAAAAEQPIDTLVRHVPPSQHPALQISLSAATTVPLQGDWYLHGWLLHQFLPEGGRNGSSCSPTTAFQLTARARQFSSFLLVIGTMAAGNRLEPKHAIILQNKDDLVIPLLMEVLPSAKDFKDAIRSLSPEQKEFCQAFRAMQLESSVFGMAIVQLKPQLEAVLGLLPGSLTKEIQLTQDLMSLFIDYQIPSDLLSFDGPDNTSRADRLSAVKEHVKAVIAVIDAEKEKIIAEEDQKAEYREALAAASQPPPVVALTETAPTPQQEAYTKQFNRGAERRKTIMANDLMAKASAPMRAAAPQAMSLAANSAPRPPPPPVADSAPVNDAAVEHVSSTKTGTLLPPNTSSSTSVEDFTMLPKELDDKLEALDTDNALRSTVLKAGLSWSLHRQENLLSKAKFLHCGAAEINKEKKKAFDLLDAITRSGSLPVEAAELHVIVALSHCFENDLMGTVIQDNINPIAKAEKSAVLLAETVHRAIPSKMLALEQDIQRLGAAFPLLFDK